MYGGYDFKSSKKEQKNEQKKTVNFSDLTNNHENLSGGVKYSKNTPGQVNFTSKPSNKLQNISWQIKGGVARDHGVLMELQLNKVSYWHRWHHRAVIQLFCIIRFGFNMKFTRMTLFRRPGKFF